MDNSMDAAKIEYLMRIYKANRDWYDIAETKAGILFTINGVFLSLVFGALATRSEKAGSLIEGFGWETWVLLSITGGCVVAALISAALCMWSYHSKYLSEFSRWKIGRDGRSKGPYPPEALWYYGHISHLDPEDAVQRLSTLQPSDEMRVLSFHIVEISGRIWKKYQYTNAGWAFTTIALTSLVFAILSAAIRTYA